MTTLRKPAELQTKTRVAFDIGSTVVKVATLSPDGVVLRQDLCPRDYEVGILAQVGAMIDGLPAQTDIQICSSANGGISVGILCLSPLFSGQALRNQVLAAGGNPLFLACLGERVVNPARVDVLLVGGGIDCTETGPMADYLARFDPAAFRYTTLMYAGNAALSQTFKQRFPEAVVIDNPLSRDLGGSQPSVANALTAAYLDDLVYKEGVSELAGRTPEPIRATPEIVNRAFYRLVSNQTDMAVAAPSVLLDIGGATTDLHYTVELIKGESVRGLARSVARYVFTDLGIFASRETAQRQLRMGPRLYEFLGAVDDGDRLDSYTALREGDYEIPNRLLAYGCLFLALDRFAHGRADGLPAGDLQAAAKFVITGGGAQLLEEEVVARVVNLFQPNRRVSADAILLDRDYRIWVEGLA